MNHLQRTVWRFTIEVAHRFCTMQYSFSQIKMHRSRYMTAEEHLQNFNDRWRDILHNIKREWWNTSTTRKMGEHRLEYKQDDGEEQDEMQKGDGEQKMKGHKEWWMLTEVYHCKNVWDRKKERMRGSCPYVTPYIVMEHIYCDHISYFFPVWKQGTLQDMELDEASCLACAFVWFCIFIT